MFYSWLFLLINALLGHVNLANAFPVGVYFQNQWVDTWTAMPQLTEYTNLPNPPFNQSGLVFPNSTIRQTLHMSIGGEEIRIRFSNAFGAVDLPITAATIALPLNGSTGASAIDTSTLQTITFSGNPNATVPPGSLIVSDPLKFPIKPQSEIAVSIYLANGQATNYITSHPGSRTTSWMSFGDYVNAANISDPSTQSVAHWYFVSAVETWATSQNSAFAIVGDSITDGRGSDTDKNDRWPDLVLSRMQSSPSTSSIAVLNQAAGGNRVLEDGLGPNAEGRIDRDFLSQSGVKYAMIFEGVNDIGDANTTTEAQEVVGDLLIAAYKQMSLRIHTMGIPFFGATITPFGTPNYTVGSYSDPTREVTRQRINQFIRHSGGVFDAVIDFDEVVRDPMNPERLRPEYNSGDWLHPNEAGYHAMANSFPLGVFQRFAGGVYPYM